MDERREDLSIAHDHEHGEFGIRAGLENQYAMISGNDAPAAAAAAAAAHGVTF